MAEMNSITQHLEDLKKQYEEQLKAAMEPARSRLKEIDSERAKLDQEEAEIRKLLGEDGPRRRRSKGKRMTSLHKKEIVGRFINEGHIRNDMLMSKELREALKDEGFGPHDFRALNDYLPQGWEAKSNGLRGTAARTTFHHHG